MTGICVYVIKKYDTLFKSVQKQFSLVDASVEDPFIKLH